MFSTFLSLVHANNSFGVIYCSLASNFLLSRLSITDIQFPLHSTTNITKNSHSCCFTCNVMDMLKILLR